MLVNLKPIFKSLFGIKKLSLMFTALLFIQIIGMTATVYASEAPQSKGVPAEVTPIEKTVITPVKQYSEEEIDQIVAELSKNYPELSVEYLREGVYKQLRGDYSINSATNVSDTANPSLSLRAAWQGITVSQMGAFLDTAIAFSYWWCCRWTCKSYAESWKTCSSISNSIIISCLWFIRYSNSYY